LQHPHQQQQQQSPHQHPPPAPSQPLPPFRGPKEYCYYDTFDARCPDGEVVVMTTAVYGRMRFGRCVKTNFGYIGCFTDVLDLLDRRCSGHRGCSVEVVEPTFDNIRPCNVELKTYLEADYRCIRGRYTCLFVGRDGRQTDRFGETVDTLSDR
jgi:hypothetical protein